MIGRYVRAFVQALKMTLRGEKLPENPLSQRLVLLNRWTVVLAERTDEVERLANQQKLDMAGVVVRIDRQNISMKMVVDLLKYRATIEYPNLLREGGKSGWSVIYTSNVNDRYYVTRLHEELAESPVKQAVVALQAHLEELPLDTTSF